MQIKTRRPGTPGASVGSVGGLFFGFGGCEFGVVPAGHAIGCFPLEDGESFVTGVGEGFSEAFRGRGVAAVDGVIAAFGSLEPYGFVGGSGPAGCGGAASSSHVWRCGGSARSAVGWRCGGAASSSHVWRCGGSARSAVGWRCGGAARAATRV